MCLLDFPRPWTCTRALGIRGKNKVVQHKNIWNTRQWQSCFRNHAANRNTEAVPKGIIFTWSGTDSKMAFERISSIRWGKGEGHGGRILVTVPASCLERGRSSDKSKMAQGDFKVLLLSFFCIAGFQLLCFPTPSFPMSWILSSQRLSHNPEEFLLWKSSKRLCFPFLLVVNSFIVCRYSLHCPYLTPNQWNSSYLHSQVWTPVLLSWSLWKPQARTSVGMFLLHTCAGWPSTKDESHTSPMQMTTANPWFWPWLSVSLIILLWFSSVIIKKRSSTSISVSKHRILCRCPTGTKVVRHWYQRLGVATAWYSQPGLGVLINNFTERQHWKRPLCAQDVFCQKGFLCFFFVTGILYIYIYFTYTCDYILMNTR